MKIKRSVGVFAIIAVFLASVSCTEKQELTATEAPNDNVFNVNGVKFEMIKVEGGIFRMGNDGYLFEVVEDEMPSHNVSLSTFYIGETEVTQELWEAVMGYNPSAQSFEDRSQYPVDNVSWDDCQTFIATLNSITGRVFGLPTEAQWEYAARGGVNKNDYTYSGSNNVQKVCWFSENTPMSRQIKTKEPNTLGIYDMSGNVAEWCSDWYGLYSSTFQENPLGHHSGTKRVVRGGSWNSSETGCRNTARSSETPDFKSSAIGFRLVLK
jgi:formylglycine-generating enzyme required for sulfatase activity